MGDIRQLIDDLRSYGEARKGEISTLTTDAASTIEKLAQAWDYKLEKQVGEEWFEYGVYNVANENELKALIEAAHYLGNPDFECKVRVVRA